MGSIFSSDKKRRAALVSEQDKAILTAKMSRDRLKQVCKRCEANIERDKERAKNTLERREEKSSITSVKKKALYRNNSKYSFRIFGQNYPNDKFFRDGSIKY
uniref:Uncharacterized protein n=1 Tax=Meloidogyne enterolobii TaxID=390850 RepID=A0A6V7TUX2_MELEN|nr:unnamed protein product [Meloidogyne enterolobii]